VFKCLQQSWTSVKFKYEKTKPNLKEYLGEIPLVPHNSICKDFQHILGCFALLSFEGIVQIKVNRWLFKATPIGWRLFPVRAGLLDALFGTFLGGFILVHFQYLKFYISKDRSYFKE
jgi:hypothetical protein